MATYKVVETSLATDTLPVGMGKLNDNFAYLASVASTEGASMIGVNNSGASNLTSITVEAALVELQLDIDTRALTSTLANYVLTSTLTSNYKTSAQMAAEGGAALVGIATGTFTGSTVQAALLELNANSGGSFPVGAVDDVASTSFTTTGSSRTLLPTEFTARYHATADCWVAFGDDTVTVDGSTGMFFARGTEIMKAPSTATYVAVKGELSIGALNATGMTNALPYELGTTVQLAYSAATNDVALPTNGGYIRVYTPTDCYITFGVGSATSSTTTGTYFEAGTEILKVPTSATYIAMVQYSIAASAYITGMN